ncbi:protein S100-A15A isoform X1 [Myotis daubentonii]|uniref:protein S100-A15A isoform X1 n=1 Tax=Myotis daubentonii TaxID=98922 RepID=UPI0028738233|nr:protein S100-A15A isoform X1 [Myotis daubentonii]
MTDTPVEESLFQIIHSYHQYAAREGDVETLSLEELKALLRDNVPRFMESLDEPCDYLAPGEARPTRVSALCAMPPGEPRLLIRDQHPSSLRVSLASLWGTSEESLVLGLLEISHQGREKPYFVTELFRAADKDKDNQICFDEFLYVLGRLLRDYHLQYHRQLCAHYCARHSLY